MLLLLGYVVVIVAVPTWALLAVAEVVVPGDGVMRAAIRAGGTVVLFLFAVVVSATAGVATLAPDTSPALRYVFFVLGLAPWWAVWSWSTGRPLRTAVLLGVLALTPWEPPLLLNVGAAMLAGAVGAWAWSARQHPLTA